jgi:hypothetical protein
MPTFANSARTNPGQAFPREKTCSLNDLITNSAEAA